MISMEQWLGQWLGKDHTIQVLDELLIVITLFNIHNSERGLRNSSIRDRDKKSEGLKAPSARRRSITTVSFLR